MQFIYSLWKERKLQCNILCYAVSAKAIQSSLWKAYTKFMWIKWWGNSCRLWRPLILSWLCRLFAHSKDVSLQSQTAPAKVFLRTGCESTAFGFSQPFTSVEVDMSSVYVCCITEFHQLVLNHPSFSFCPLFNHFCSGESSIQLEANTRLLIYLVLATQKYIAVFDLFSAICISAGMRELGCGEGRRLELYIYAALSQSLFPCLVLKWKMLLFMP